MSIEIPTRATGHTNVSHFSPALPIQFHFARVLIGLLLFGLAFGYVEAAVVVYLRAIYEPMRQKTHPERTSGDLFPLLRLSDLEAAGEVHLRRLATEVIREAATLAMLTSAGLLFARSFYQWFWDHRNIAAGGLPNPFNWPLFALGLILGTGAFLHAVVTGKPSAEQRRSES